VPPRICSPAGSTGSAMPNRATMRKRYRVRRLVALLVIAVVVVGVGELVHQLRHHSAPRVQPGLAPTANVTIIPGLSRAQIQKQLHSDGIKGDYVAMTFRSSLLDPHDYGAPKRAHSLEGFLWPDTYNLYKPVKLRALIDDQLTAFKQEFTQVNLSYAKSKNLTGYDVLKIASLISEESMLPQDAPVAASVIYNRLRMGMDLGLDSTVSYATGNYGDLTQADLDSKSPWNTTNHAGLPPTPIDNPDLAMIKAAAHPKPTDYLYFINRVCGNGALRFTANYGQFELWSAAWNAAVSHAAADGGSAEFCGKRK
jgi:uncharacterized YceG family protein